MFQLNKLNDKAHSERYHLILALLCKGQLFGQEIIGSLWSSQWVIGDYITHTFL